MLLMAPAASRAIMHAECGKKNLWTTTKGGSHRVGGMPAVVEILGFARDLANGDEISASDNRL
jgi:hypothetical protein